MFGMNSTTMGLKNRTGRTRLGELLVRKNKLTTQELRAALKGQKDSGKQLGQYLCDEGIISKGSLRVTLMEQFAYRALAMSLTAFIAVAGVTSPKSARASDNNVTQVAYAYNMKSGAVDKSLDRTGNIRQVSLGSMPRAAVKVAPQIDNRLFGSREVQSRDLKAFTKWNGVMERLDNAGLQNWGRDLEGFKGLSLEGKIHAVNNYVNKVRYVEDNRNWAKSDYWATPVEFFARGGDCEDFAIAKYAALKKLGVSESQMRLAIVQDRVKNIPHAILIVYTSTGPVFLDNQIKSVQKVSEVNRYKPVYSINKQAWWRHV